MTDNNKFIPNTPKTYEQFLLEEQQLTSEQKQSLYPELIYEDLSVSRGYGPCNNCGNSNHTFRLRVALRNTGPWATVEDETSKVEKAIQWSRDIINRSGNWGDPIVHMMDGSYFMTAFNYDQTTRNQLSALVNTYVVQYNSGQTVDATAAVYQQNENKMPKDFWKC